MVAVPFSEVPRETWLTSLSEAEIVRQAHLITPAGVEYHGGAAMTAALRPTSFKAVGWALDLPGLRLARDVGYAFVARSRGVLSHVIS